eukprot:2809451-Rhodomonas_salina.4
MLTGARSTRSRAGVEVQDPVSSKQKTRRTPAKLTHVLRSQSTCCNVNVWVHVCRALFAH